MYQLSRMLIAMQTGVHSLLVYFYCVHGSVILHALQTGHSLLLSLYHGQDSDEEEDVGRKKTKQATATAGSVSV